MRAARYLACLLLTLIGRAAPAQRVVVYRAAEQSWRFYAALYGRAGRPVLVDGIRRLHVRARRHAGNAPASERAFLLRTQRRQRAILASLRAGRGDDAVEGLRRLIGSAVGDLGRVLGAGERTPLRPVRGSKRRS